MKIFLDTNILMDYLVGSCRPNYEASARLLAEVKNNPDISAFVSVQSITDCSYFFTKKSITSNDFFLEPVRKILALVRLRAHSDHNVYECFSRSFTDFEDEMLLRSAIDNDCAYFITGDQKILEKQPFPLIKAIHPADFLAKAAAK